MMTLFTVTLIFKFVMKLHFPQSTQQLKLLKAIGKFFALSICPKVFGFNQGSHGLESQGEKHQNLGDQGK